MRTSLFLCATALGVFGGCSRSAHHPEASVPLQKPARVFPAALPRPLPTMNVRVAHRTTNLGANFAPEVIVGNFGEPVGQKLLESIASHFSVKTWPSFGDVPVLFEFADAQLSDRPQPYARIVLRPTAPLQSGWYALTYDDAATEAQLDRLAPMVPSPGHGRIARFNPASNPTVASITIDKTAMGQSIALNMSEPIAPASDADVTKHVALRTTTGQALHCPWRHRGENDTGFFAVVFDCADSSELDAVDVGPVLRGMKQATLGETISAHKPAIADLASCGDHCRMWRPD
jgi:hypothetical protein